MRLQRLDYHQDGHRWHRWYPPNDGNDVMINCLLFDLLQSSLAVALCANRYQLVC